MAKKNSHTGLILAVGAVAALGIFSAYRRTGKPSLFVRDWLPFGLNAMTVPPFGIMVTEKHSCNVGLLEHELVHWKQFQQSGLLGYYLNYLRGHVARGYDGNPMEVEARFREDCYCKENYTECVREGYSKTVYEPSFRD